MNPELEKVLLKVQKLADMRAAKATVSSRIRNRLTCGSLFASRMCMRWGCPPWHENIIWLVQ